MFPNEEPPPYNTFEDLYVRNPQKRFQVLALLTSMGMTREEALRAIDEYVATQKGESQ